MAVDLRCPECLKLWEVHGAAAADLREVSEPTDRGAIEWRLQAAAQAINDHQKEFHPTSSAPER